MALLDTYGENNRQESVGLDVTYSRTLIHGSWTYESGVGIQTTRTTAWQYTRRATKQYKYVGMTKESAETCAAAVRAAYVRATKASEWQANGEHAGTFVDVNAGSYRMANVDVRHTAGEMWEVDISVDETDVKIRTTAVSPQSLFTAEDQRTYNA